MRFALDLPNAHGTTFVVKKIILKFVTPTIKKVGAALARLPPARPDIAELRRILKGTLGDERE